MAYAAVVIGCSMACVSVRDDRAPGAGDGRHLESLLDEIHCTALDAIEYLTELQIPSGTVDAMGAASIRRYLELLDELASLRE
jgi:hypothetical protein